MNSEHCPYRFGGDDDAQHVNASLRVGEVDENRTDPPVRAAITLGEMPMRFEEIGRRHYKRNETEDCCETQFENVKPVVV
jgi:hypothetical protein